MVKCKFCGFDNLEQTDYCLRCSKKLDYTNLVEKKENYQEINSFKYSIRDLYNLKGLFSNDLSNDIDYHKKEKIILIATVSSSVVCGSGFFYIKNYYLGFIFIMGQFTLLITAFMLKNYDVNIFLFVVASAIYFINIIITYNEASNIEGELNYD